MAINLDRAWDDKSNAGRQFRWRQRQKFGLFPVSFDIGQSEIKNLIARGFLTRAECEDKEAISAAVYAALKTALGKNWTDPK